MDGLGVAVLVEDRGVGDAVTLRACHPRVQLGVEVVDPGGRELDDLCELHAFASRTRLKGVSATRRKVLNPAPVTSSRSRPSPAWAPRAAPTSWDNELGVHRRVENP